MPLGRQAWHIPSTQAVPSIPGEQHSVLELQLPGLTTQLTQAPPMQASFESQQSLLTEQGQLPASS
jgi:hypothetical protein